jgi:MFS family permease
MTWLFAAGAALCATAPSLAVMIVGRIIMGASAAQYPLAVAIVRDEVQPARVPVGVGMVASVNGLGGAAGLACGGLIADGLGFRAVFWVPLIVALLGVVAVSRWVRPSSLRTGGRVDWTGALLASVMLAAPLVALSQTVAWGVDARTVLLFLAGAVALVAFGLYERRHPDPLLDLPTLRRPDVAITNVSTLFAGFGMYGTGAVLMQFVQVPESSGYGLGATATQAGLFLVPGTLLFLVASFAGGHLTVRTGARFTLLLGCSVTAVAHLGIAAWHGSALDVYLWITLMYLGVGMAAGPPALLILRAVSARRSAESTAVNMATRHVGSSVGTQFTAVLLALSAGTAAIPTEAAFRLAFLAMAIACVVAAALVLVLPREPRLARRPHAESVAVPT